MRRLARLLPFLVLLALLAIAAFVLLQVGPLTEHIRNLVQQELRAQLDREVTVGGASLTITGGVTLREVKIRNRDGSTLLRAPRIEARVGGLKDLLTRTATRVEIRSIRLTRPELTLIRQPDGTLNISDLIKEKEEPGKFRGTIIADDSRVTFIDGTAGGQTTTIRGANATVRYPSPGVTRFTVSAPSNEGAFDALKLRGEANSVNGSTDISGAVEGLSVPFAILRIPGFTALSATAGAADVKGELVITRTGDAPAFTYDVSAEVREAEVSFPWLRRPAKQVAGQLQFADGRLRLKDVTGTIEGAPAEVNGEITLVPVPEFDLDLTVTGIRYPQLRALFPRAALPAGLLLPSDLRIKAKIEGPASQVKVSGDATVKVIKFRAIPWHDLVGRFEYENGKLKISNLKGHGSPRQFSADFEIDLRGMPKASGNLSLLNMPAAMLAGMAGIKGDYRGLVKARVTGLVGNGSALKGDFVVDEAGVGAIPLGRIRGEFTYSPAGVKLRRIQLTGPTAAGQAEADIAPDGRFRATAKLSTVNLSALGPAVRLSGLTGRCCAEVSAAGKARAGQMTAQLALGPGKLQEQPFDSLTATLSATRGRLEVKDLKFLSPLGRAAGAISLTGLQQPRELSQLRGEFSFSQFRLPPLLPDSLTSLVTAGTLDGTVGLSGSLPSPIVRAEARGHDIVVAGMPTETTQARVSYQQGRFVVEQVVLTTLDKRLTLTGGYTSEQGFDLKLIGNDVDVAAAAAELKTRFGVSLKGHAEVTATLSGDLTHPRVWLALTTRDLTANSLPFDACELDAILEGKTAQVTALRLRRGEGTVAISGNAALDGRILDLTAVVKDVTLGTLISIGDSAVWRLYQEGKRYPFSPPTTAYRVL